MTSRLFMAQTDSLSTISDTTTNDSTYPPEYPGGQEAMLTFIEDELLLRVPTTEIVSDIGETVSLSFRINKKGEVTYFKILNTSNQFFTDYVEEAFLAMPKWIPGKQEGKLHSVKLQFQFRITEVLGSRGYIVKIDRFTNTIDETTKPLKVILAAVAAALMLTLIVTR